MLNFQNIVYLKGFVVFNLNLNVPFRSVKSIYNGVLDPRERTMSSPPPPHGKKEQIIIPHSGVWTYFWLHPYMNIIMYSFNIEMDVTDLVQGRRNVLKLYIKICLYLHDYNY